ncbi:TonB-dependent receptor [Polymorphobacter sp. PAMC 29334]|uniref:TonB-dependent receptor domain-containing protein n=1 Tax=Polymorphobacter sp. PAMC 29334 TaxID=2862331 RepID=UPI001C76C731|nr:TonB-dependent receptor [Polymorphobacter sp. PAMC 29334]QYE36077.1 TonB-dependent receptor [Polymorphobacter sp. PAMC 29334]
MVNLSLKTVLLRSTMLVGATAFAFPALAQTASGPGTPAATSAGQTTPDQTPEDSAEKDITVTGTLIKNANLTQSAPINVTTSEEIHLRQSNVAEELLRELPGAVANVGSAVNNGTGGSFFVDLRGLGPNRNIVLLNGTRIAPSGLAGQVDLNNIPLALVDRVEVLTGGASTTYGADAVAGVVNFVTKQDFAGAELNVSDQITEKGDGNYRRADLTIGGNFADGKGNAVVSLGYQNSEAVFQGNRPFSVQARNPVDGSLTGAGSSTAVPAVLSGYGGPTRQVDPVTGTLSTAAIQTFNFNPYNIFQTPFKRYNIFGQAHYEIAPDIQVYSEALFSKNTVSQIIAPSGSFTNTYSLPLSNPYIPAGVLSSLCAGAGLTAAQCTAAAAAKNPNDPAYKLINTQIRRRFVEQGNRLDDFTTTIFNAKGGVRGKITDAIDFDVYGAYGESENAARSSNQGLLSRLQQSLLSTNTTTCLTNTNGCVPINLFGPAGSISPASLAFVTPGSTLITTRSTLAQLHGQISGDIGYTSPFATDPISFAVGGEYRSYYASTSSDNASQTPGEILGSGGAAIDVAGRYNVQEAFTEVIVPLVQGKPGFELLQLEGGYRYSHYSLQGNTSTYKGGFQYAPVSGIKFRGTYNRAVRAPNINELFAPVTGGLGSLATDPCATFTSGGALKTGQALGNPATNANLRAVCIAQGATAANVNLIQDPSAQQPNITTGGNLGLKPETADTYTIGGVFQPTFLRNFSISADYYHILVRGAITTPSEGDVIASCFSTGQNPGLTVTGPCTSIKRNALNGQLDGSPNNPPGLPLTLSNLGRLATDGIDVVGNYSHDVGFAKLGLSVNANYTFHSRFKQSPTSLDRDCVSHYSTSCTSIQPKFSVNARSTLSFSSFDVSLLWRHLSGSTVEGDDPASATPAQLTGTAVGFYAPYSSIKSYDYFDLTGRVSVMENLDLTFTVQNLGNRQPPLVGQNIGATAFNSGNTYPSTYDALGRRYAISVRVRY